MINVVIFGWGMVFAIGVIMALVGSTITTFDPFNAWGEHLLEIGIQILLVCLGLLVITGIIFISVNALRGNISFP